MIEISCFYIHYNREPVNFTFIKYEKYMRIYVNEKKMVIEIDKLKNYPDLLNLYILSLLCTDDPSQIENYYDVDFHEYVYGIMTEKYWKCLYFTVYSDIIRLEINYFNNPFLSKEPTRETSLKKQKKIIKKVHNYIYVRKHIKEPLKIIDIYITELIKDINQEMKKIIDYEKKIYLLCCIKSFNKDIYANVIKFI